MYRRQLFNIGKGRVSALMSSELPAQTMLCFSLLVPLIVLGVEIVVGCVYGFVTEVVSYMPEIHVSTDHTRSSRVPEPVCRCILQQRSKMLRIWTSRPNP